MISSLKLVDAGVVEISPQGDHALSHAASNALRLKDLETNFVSDEYLFAGYPNLLIVPDLGHWPMYQFLGFHLPRAGSHDTPLPPIHLRDEHHVCLAIRGMPEDNDNETDLVTLPYVGGMSGGGYFSISEKLEPKLAFTHAKSTQDPIRLRGHDYRFAWGASVLFHLGMIANAAPDLRDEILSAHPNAAIRTNMTPVDTAEL